MFSGSFMAKMMDISSQNPPTVEPTDQTCGVSTIKWLLLFLDCQTKKNDIVPSPDIRGTQVSLLNALV